MFIPVILCGGSGSRLWPVSREGFPKPFILLPDGETLIQKTIRRARASITACGQSNAETPILFVCGEAHGFLIEQACMANDVGHPRYLLQEPCARNTAPAIALACLWAKATYGEDACLLVLAADHLIHDEAAFAKQAVIAYQAAKKPVMITFGITPISPETGYGYLEQGAAIDAHAFKVKRFVEKPTLQTAQTYLDSGQYAWNSGMFCFRAITFLTELARHAPTVSDAAQQTFQTTVFKTDKTLLDQATFKTCPSISVDYAVMEKSDCVHMLRANFDWDDIGAWPALAKTISPDAHGNRVFLVDESAQAKLLNSKRCFVHSGRTVAAIGVSDLMIIDTADALLIAHAEQAQQVKTIVDELNADKQSITKLHTTVYRPWGTYTILEDKADCKVKRLLIYPGASISLQLHHHRSEHWVVVTGIATVVKGDETLILKTGESVFIPAKTIHRLKNNTASAIAIIETQVGTYFGEDDIIRLEDQYGRLK